jgi:hypothetical protein
MNGARVCGWPDHFLLVVSRPLLIEASAQLRSHVEVRCANERASLSKDLALRLLCVV